MINIKPLNINNKPLGVSLPFNQNKVFNITYSTQDNIKSKLINLLLTNKGEIIFNPNFGSSLLKYLFQPQTQNNIDLIKNDIKISINKYIPEIGIKNIEILPSENVININVGYIINKSNQEDSINLQIN